MIDDDDRDFRIAAMANDMVESLTERLTELNLKLAAAVSERDELRLALDRRIDESAEKSEAESSRFWFAAWKQGNRARAELRLELAKVERILGNIDPFGRGRR
jgi:hypothetical protein